MLNSLVNLSLWVSPYLNLVFLGNKFTAWRAIFKAESKSVMAAIGELKAKAENGTTQGGIS
jgi:hypothetical protein